MQRIVILSRRLIWEWVTSSPLFQWQCPRVSQFFSKQNFFQNKYFSKTNYLILKNSFLKFQYFSMEKVNKHFINVLFCLLFCFLSWPRTWKLPPKVVWTDNSESSLYFLPQWFYAQGSSKRLFNLNVHCGHFWVLFNPLFTPHLGYPFQILINH